MNIEVLRATSNHALIIAEFNQQMAAETENKTLPWDLILPGVQSMLANDSMGFYLVAKQDTEVVGHLANVLRRT